MPGPGGDLATLFAGLTERKTLGDIAKDLRIDDGRRKAFVWLTGGSTGPTVDSKTGGSSISGGASGMVSARQRWHG